MDSEQNRFPGFNLIQISAPEGDLKASFLPEAGGRMISLSWQEKELFYSSIEGFQPFTFSESATEKEIREFKRNSGFGVWGGDKTWIAPQQLWWEGTPPAATDRGVWEYSISGSQEIHMKSPVCKETLLVAEKTVTIFSERLRIREKITAVRDWSVPRGVWNVTQFLRPLYVYIPSSLIAVKPYPEEGDSLNLLKEKLLEWPLTTGDDLDPGEDLSFVRIDCTKPAHFKYGGIPRKGFIVSVHPAETGYLCITRKFGIYSRSGKDYPHGSQWEVYNSPDQNYMELELHSTASELKSGESVTLDHEWFFSIVKNNEELWELLESNQ